MNGRQYRIRHSGGRVRVTLGLQKIELGLLRSLTFVHHLLDEDLYCQVDSSNTKITMKSPTAEKRKASGDAGDAPKKQKTIEDTLEPASRASKSKQNHTAMAKEESASPVSVAKATSNTTNGHNAFDEVRSDAKDVHSTSQKGRELKNEGLENDTQSIQTSEERAAAVPASIMEKGIIYFFFRGRVGVDDPSGVEDVARSYIVLRPLPRGAKIGDGPIEDMNNGRVLALPKKVLPKGGRDKFLVFVDRKGLSVEGLRDVFKGNEYATKTAGLVFNPLFSRAYHD